jgi:hypothetical protein
MAQLQALLFGAPAGSAAGSAAAQAGTAEAASAAAAAAAAVLDVGRLTYIADALHEVSEVRDAPGCYAPPLLPLFR